MVFDWEILAQIATCVTGLSAVVVPILTYVWQKKDRKADKKEQELLRRKEDSLRQWNANYPHRLRFYTEFYDTLFRFVNYHGSIREKLDNGGTETRIDIRIRPMDVLDFYNTFNRLDEEAKMLFGSEISDPVHMVYEKIRTFVDEHNIADLSMIIENNKYKTGVGKDFNERLKVLQSELKAEKLNSSLRDFFVDVLTFPIDQKD